MKKILSLIPLLLALTSCATSNQNQSYSYHQPQKKKSFNEVACENGSGSSCVQWMKEEVKKGNNKVAWEAMQAACYNGHDLSCKQEKLFKSKLESEKKLCSSKKAESCVGAANYYYSIGEVDWSIYHLEQACSMNLKKACDLKIQMETIEQQRIAGEQAIAQRERYIRNQQRRQNISNGLIMMNQLYYNPNQRRNRNPSQQRIDCKTRPIRDIYGKFIRYETDCQNK